MKRRTLDLFFSIGGLGVAVLLLIFGIVLQQEADFADDYVRDQFTQQAIYFPPVEELTEEEAESDCLVEFASQDEEGRLLDTGEEAECYANDFIGLHLRNATGGLSYAQLGEPQNRLRGQIEEAEEAGEDTEDLEAELAQVDRQRDTAFRGETLRGILLTAFGFSELGARAALAAKVAFVGAALMLVLSIAGFIHYARTSPSATVE